MKNKKDMSYNNVDIGEVVAGVTIGVLVLVVIYKYIQIFVIGEI